MHLRCNCFWCVHLAVMKVQHGIDILCLPLSNFQPIPRKVDPPTLDINVAKFGNDHGLQSSGETHVFEIQVNVIETAMIPHRPACEDVRQSNCIECFYLILSPNTPAELLSSLMYQRGSPYIVRELSIFHTSQNWD